MYKGWIVADASRKAELEALGVKLGEYNNESACFENCEVSEATMAVLDGYWGKWYWHLEWSEKDG